MIVTEFALLHLTPTTATPASPLPNHVRTILRDAMKAQDAWHAARFPSLPSSSRERAAAWFSQVEDPSYLLTVARWPSVATHHEWIGSEGNQRIMKALTEGAGQGEGVGEVKGLDLGEQTTMTYDPVVKQWVPKKREEAAPATVDGGSGGGGAVIVPQDTVLLHVAGDIFGSVSPSAPSAESGAAARAGVEDGAGAESIPLLKSPVISVSRVWVARENREAWAAGFENAREVLEAYVSPHLVRYGWRDEGGKEKVEKGAVAAAAEEDEFVVVGGWESVQRHSAFAQAPGFERYNALRPLMARADMKHYKPLSLD